MSGGTGPHAMRTTVRIEPLALPHPFTFAHGTVRDVDVIHLGVTTNGAHGDGERGDGEIAVGLEHGQHAPTIAREAKDLADLLARREEPDDITGVAAVLSEHAAQTSGPARMAVEMAFLDLAARRAGLPLWRLLRLPDPGTVRLMRTVPIDEEIPEGVRPVKIKLGGPQDAQVLQRLVGVPGPIVLDANRAWSHGDWVRLSLLVTKVAPAVFEDPVHDPELLAEIGAALPDTSVILDEGIETISDVARAAATAGGANIKLMRFGGLTAGIEALRTLRAANAVTMLGCYLEPTRAIAYSAQLAGLCDWKDLDGHFWLTRTPPTMSYRLDSSVPGIPPLIHD